MTIFAMRKNQKVILDKDTPIESVVTIVSFSHKKLFVEVGDDKGNTWITMSDRLSEIKKI